MTYYQSFACNGNKKAFTIHNMLTVTMYNKKRTRPGKRCKCVIKKVKRVIVVQILADKKNDIIKAISKAIRKISAEDVCGFELVGTIMTGTKQKLDLWNPRWSLK